MRRRRSATCSTIRCRWCETAARDAELIPALDRLSRSLRERIGESLVSIRADEPLERVSTSSLEALRRYTMGTRLEDAGKSEQAIHQLLREATEIDTGFAMAWRKLAVVLGNTSAPFSAVADASTAAYRAMLDIDPNNQIALNNLSGAMWDRRRYAEAESLAVH
jgi:Flp pilus assembly protein TadD